MGVARKENEQEGVHLEFEDTFPLSCLLWAWTFDGFALPIIICGSVKHSCK